MCKYRTSRVRDDIVQRDIRSNIFSFMRVLKSIYISLEGCYETMIKLSILYEMFSVLCLFSVNGHSFQASIPPSVVSYCFQFQWKTFARTGIPFHPFFLRSHFAESLPNRKQNTFFGFLEVVKNTPLAKTPSCSRSPFKLI